MTPARSFQVTLQYFCGQIDSPVSDPLTVNVEAAPEPEPTETPAAEPEAPATARVGIRSTTDRYTDESTTDHRRSSH